MKTALTTISTRLVKYHVIVNGRPACGVGSPIPGTEEPAQSLLSSERCERSGCRQHFEADDDRRHWANRQTNEPSYGHSA